MADKKVTPPSDDELNAIITEAYRGLGLTEAGARIAAGRDCRPRSAPSAKPTDDQQIDAVISEGLAALGCSGQGLTKAIAGRPGDRLTLLQEPARDAK
jgi:hypothetical protein